MCIWDSACPFEMGYYQDDYCYGDECGDAVDEVDTTDLSGEGANWKDEVNDPKPFMLMAFASNLISIGGLWAYTEQIVDKTDGPNYKGMFYATELTWLPVATTSMGVMLEGSMLSWVLFECALAEGLAGVVAYNWLGMGWAQYMRTAGATTFGSSDNLTAMGINFAWNVVTGLFYKKMAVKIWDNTKNYVDAWEAHCEANPDDEEDCGEDWEEYLEWKEAGENMMLL